MKISPISFVSEIKSYNQPFHYYYYMQQDAKYGLAYQLISDILPQQDILISVNIGGGSIAEARVEKGLPFRIREKWATIGDEDRP